MSNVEEKQTVLKDAKDLSDISVDKVVHLGSIDKLLGSDHEEKINVNEKSNSIEKLICGIFSIDF